MIGMAMGDYGACDWSVGIDMEATRFAP